MSQRTCTVDGCAGVHLARGFCRSHYNRWHYAGSTELPERSAACEHCGEPVKPRSATGPGSVYCSRSCRGKASYARNAERLRAKARAKRASQREPRRCLCCYAVFAPGTARQIYCSKTCSKRMQNAARRAKRREAYVERLHWRVLFNEDGPNCYICGDPTDPTDSVPIKGATLIGLAYPTLDHIIPLSRGGSHERANVRLAHHYCNSVKGDRPLSEVT